MIFELHRFLLIFIRITAFIVATPGYSYRGIPNITKITLSAGIALFVYLSIPDAVEFQGLLPYGLLVIRETVLGLALGFISRMVFSAIEMAGKLIDFQVGFSIGAVYAPTMGASVSNYGRTYYWIGIAVFFLLDMHRILMEAILRSFSYVPIGTEEIGNMGTGAILEVFARVFEIGINLAAPMIITVLMTDAVLGIISRTVPQINVFMLGMPMKSMVSFFVFTLSLSWILHRTGTIISTIPDYIDGFLRLFGSG